MGEDLVELERQQESGKGLEPPDPGQGQGCGWLPIKGAVDFDNINEMS
jgi:hypothetical protein